MCQVKGGGWTTGGRYSPAGDWERVWYWVGRDDRLNYNERGRIIHGLSHRPWIAASGVMWEEGRYAKRDTMQKGRVVRPNSF